MSTSICVQEKLAQKQGELDTQRARAEQLIAERDANAATVAQLQQDTDRAVAQLAAAHEANNGAAAGNGGAGFAAPDVGDANMGVGGDEQHAGNDAVNVGQMTIQEIKEWLTDAGHEEEVWALASRKAPRVKKDEWVQLIRSKQ